MLEEGLEYALEAMVQELWDSSVQRFLGLWVDLGLETGWESVTAHYGNEMRYWVLN
jgi:hypothetical protein